ncbi:hypothetical protein [Staphylococcus aureus]|uniref:hypothetical protein n=1 Tax=Staphylococcus aureus TaxID=1280 RepID=UPI001CE1A964|nr:hypothetical protein [Staphylococcus aureus]MCA1235802.1 hypothetical protein [Staphylococcus aureus]
MENKIHYFEAHGKDYKLEVAKDMYGCEGVLVIENGLYMGMMDFKDERDYKQDEVYC